MRPMKNFGILLKALFNTQKSGIFWVKVPQTFKNKEDKSNFIYSTIELLNIKIKIDDNQNTKH